MRRADFTVDGGRQRERIARRPHLHGPESAQWYVNGRRRGAAQIAEPYVSHDTDNLLADRRRLADAIVGATNGGGRAGIAPREDFIDDHSGGLERFRIARYEITPLHEAYA